MPAQNVPPLPLLPTALHLTSQYPPHTLGGLGTHVAGLCAALAPQWPVSILSPALIQGQPTAAGDPAHPDVALNWALAAVRQVLPASFTILHAHNYEVALPALAARALTNAPLVVTLHLPAPPPFRHREQQLLEQADAVIAVSRSLAAEYRARRGRIPAPVVIPNGVDPSFFHPAPVARAPHRLLLAGRCVPQKGVDLALQALSHLLPEFPDLELRVAGAGPWEAAYRHLSRRLGCPDRVTWLGWLPPERLRQEYHRCGVFLMPSRFEPFGLSALEAMACGATVVAAETGGLPEFIRDGETGRLVPPGDPDALAAALRELLCAPEERLRLGEAAARSAQQWTWLRAAQQTIDVYQALPARPPRLLTDHRAAEAEARALIAEIDRNHGS